MVVPQLEVHDLEVVQEVFSERKEDLDLAVAGEWAEVGHCPQEASLACPQTEAERQREPQA